MGEIIHSKILLNKKVVCKILIDENEALNLKGHLKRIHVFSSNLCTNFSSINVRGNKGVTKYFKIPLSIRSRKRPIGMLIYQKLETATKIFYIYTVQKEIQEDQENQIEEQKIFREKSNFAIQENSISA